MNRLLVGIMLLAIVCIAGSCTDEDEYTQGQWMKKASYNGVYRAYASGFTIGNYGYATSVRHSSSMRWPTSVAGETTVPIWWISGSSTEATGPSCVTLPIRTPTMTMTMTTPSHGPKPYPSSSVEGDLWLREYVTALP